MSRGPAGQAMDGGHSTPFFGGVEAGGTKFVCAVGRGPGELRDRITIPTRLPAETLPEVVEFFRRQPEPIAALGIGAFGPLDLDSTSAGHGTILATPKLAWRGTNILAALADGLGVPVAIDTDVNAAAIGERLWGAARGVDDVVYLTVGTGIGGGVLVRGRAIHGATHPEIGHLPVRHDRAADPFDGICPSHGDCLEGLASGPAIEARWGMPARDLPPDHPGWTLEVGYLALGLVSCIYALAPARIVLGGGVMNQGHLLGRIRDQTRSLLAGYLVPPALGEAGEGYVVAAGLGGDAGVLGGIALARALAEDASAG